MPAVLARGVAVVGRKPHHHPPLLEHVVPERRRETVALHHLGTAVPDLEPGKRRRREHVVGTKPTPVRVTEERDSALVDDPPGKRLDVRECLARLGQASDAEREHLGLVVGGGRGRRQLAGGHDDDAVVLDVGHMPVIRDREHIEAEIRIVIAEHGGQGIAVRVRRVRVELAPEPHPVVTEERAGHGSRASGCGDVK